MGPSFQAKTIDYSSRFPAYGTVTFPGPNCNEQVIVDGFHIIDFSQLYHTPIVTSTVYKAGCNPYANPRLSLPAELTDVDPAWKTCQPLFYGAFDPPSVLSKASRLAPAQADPAAITPTPPPNPSLPAKAQATPTAQIPVATIALNDDGRKAAQFDPPAPVVDTKDGNLLIGDTPNPAASSKNSVSNSQKADVGKEDPSGELRAPTAAVLTNSPAQTLAPDVSLHKAAAANGGPLVQTTKRCRLPLQ